MKVTTPSEKILVKPNKTTLKCSYKPLLVLTILSGKSVFKRNQYFYIFLFSSKTHHQIHIQLLPSQLHI